MTTQEWLNRRDHGAGIMELQLGKGPSNTLSAAFLDDFVEQVTLLNADDAVSIILLSSPFKAFSSGTDDAQHTPEFKAALDRALITLLTCGTPTLAVINGDIHGPALSLALTCDSRVGVTRSGYCFNAVTSGVSLTEGETVLINEMLDPNVARRLLLTGQTIGPVAARNYGILDIVAEDQEDLWMYALREAKMLTSLSQDAFKTIKTQIRARMLHAMEMACGNQS